jgi:hypothetical protein
MPKGYSPYNKGRTIQLEITTTVAAHADNDVIGGLLTLTKDLGREWHGCELRAISLKDRGAQTNQFTLQIFRQLPSTIANGAAYAPLDADLAMRPPGHTGITIASGDFVEVTTSDEGTITEAGINNINLGIDVSDGTTSTFYAYLINSSGGAFTPIAVDDLTLFAHVWID